MFDKEAINAINEGAGISQAATAIEQSLSIGAGAAFLPDHYTKHDLETFMPKRRRARGVMSTIVTRDFARYVTTNAELGTAVFVDADQMTATAVLNLGTPDIPGHCDNKAKLSAKRTAAYTALLQHVNKGLKQVEAAEFIEDWAQEIACFNEAGPITVPKAIAAIRKLTIESMRKLESSEQSLSASKSAFESVQATSADPIPTTIYFDCEPYLGLAKRQFVIRLGILTTGDKPMISLRVVKQELHNEEMAAEFAAIVGDSLGVKTPVLIGSYTS